MEYFDLKRGRSSRFMLDASEEEFSFSEQSSPRVIKNHHEHFQALYTSRDRFCDFVIDLKELRCSEIREDILAHCEQNTKK